MNDAYQERIKGPKVDRNRFEELGKTKANPLGPPQVPQHVVVGKEKPVLQKEEANRKGQTDQEGLCLVIVKKTG